MDAGCRNARKRLLSCLKAARPHFRHTPSDRRYLSSPHCGRVSPLGTDGAELVESPPFAGRADRRAASIFNEDTLAQGVKFELAAFAVRLFPAPIPVRRRAPWESPRTMSRLRQEARRPNRRDRAASPLARQKATGRLRPPAWRTKRRAGGLWESLPLCDILGWTGGSVASQSPKGGRLVEPAYPRLRRSRAASVSETHLLGLPVHFTWTASSGRSAADIRVCSGRIAQGRVRAPGALTTRAR